MKTIRWGILATGNIAASMAQAIHEVEDAELVAVASRTQAGAEVFGKRWEIPRRYAGYEKLVQDKDVDVVYIATPHSHHFDNMQLCLNAGKHVLCEKAFTLNSRQAAACIDLARRNDLFLMEAMWMRFFPAMAQVRAWVQQGQIGTVRSVQADFCFHQPFDPAHRLYNPRLGGGALLDLGVYLLSLTTMLLGFPQQIQSHAYLNRTGVDELDTLLLSYDGGASANLTCSMRFEKRKEAFILGSAGHIHIHEEFFRPDRLTLRRHRHREQVIRVPYRGNGYVYEVEEVHDCLRSGRSESEIMPLDESLRSMQLMDRLRAEWGVKYPGE
jgi:predicted dehydrogenase